MVKVVSTPSPMRFGFLFLLAAGFALLISGQVGESLLVEAQNRVDAGDAAGAEAIVRSFLEKHSDSANGHYLLAYVLFRGNHPRTSLDEYKAAARYRAPNALDLAAIGCDYFALEDYSNAIRWLNQAVERDLQNTLALYYLGRSQYNEKQFDEAITTLRKFVDLEPNNVKAWDILGLALEARGKPEDAVAAYLTAITKNQAEPAPYLDLGTLLVATNRTTEAMPYLRRAIELTPSDSRAYRELGKAYLAENQLPAALIELRKAAAIAPDSAPVHFLLAQLYRKQGHPEEAEKEAARYAELTGAHSAPDDPLRSARALLQGGKPAEAEGLVRKFLEKQSNSADGHYLLGYILFREAKAKESLAEYTAAAKLRTPTAADLEVVGSNYVVLGAYGDADKWFTKAVEWNPKDALGWYYLGRTKYNENRFDEAIAAFQKCLELDPKNVKAEDNLGLSYDGLGRTEEAIAAYEKAIEWQADVPVQNAGPYFDLGKLLMARNRETEALPYLMKAVEIAPQEARGYGQLGKAYLHLDQLDKAQTALEKAVELAPNDASQHYVLGQVYRKRGWTDKAQAESRTFAALSKK